MFFGDLRTVLLHAVGRQLLLNHGLLLCLQFDGSHVVVNGVDARMGKHGSLHIAGHLPLHPPPPPDYQFHQQTNTNSDGLKQQQQEEIVLNIQALDLRIANVYSGESRTYVCVQLIGNGMAAIAIAAGNQQQHRAMHS